MLPSSADWSEDETERVTFCIYFKIHFQRGVVKAIQLAAVLFLWRHQTTVGLREEKSDPWGETERTWGFQVEHLCCVAVKMNPRLLNRLVSCVLTSLCSSLQSILISLLVFWNQTLIQLWGFIHLKPPADSVFPVKQSSFVLQSIIICNCFVR